jgi:hypothetical protein
MRSTTLALCLASLSWVLSCGLEGQAAGKAFPASVNDPVVLPLAYVNGHLFVTLADDRLGNLSLMVDTGTERTIIAKSVARKSELHKAFWNRTVSLNGYGSDPSRQDLRTVSVALRTGQTVIFAGSAGVLDLAGFDKKLGHPTNGILGWDFFQKWCSTLDFGQKRLTLHPLSQCAPPVGTQATLNGEWSSHGLILNVLIAFPNGRSARASLGVDTGNDATLMLNTQFRTPAGLRSDQPNASIPDPRGAGTRSVATTGWGINGAYDGDIVPVRRIDFEGGKLYTKDNDGTTILIGRKGSFPPWHWWDGADGEARMNHDGSIGNGILEQMLWTFDPVAKKVYIQAYSH